MCLGRQAAPGDELMTGLKRRSVKSSTLAAIALAVIGPMPGMVASRRLASSARYQLRIFANVFLDLAFDAAPMAHQSVQNRPGESW
jgi:hypothetical protein